MNDPRDHHRARMAERRQRQRNRQPGFTPMPNGRINANMAAALAAIMARDELLGVKRRMADQQQGAVRDVARTLPHPAMVWSARRRPSKQDTVAGYLKPIRARSATA